MNHFEHNHDSHEELLNQAWEQSQQNAVIRGLSAGEKIEDLLYQLPGFKESFHDLENLDCSDGRVVTGKKMGLAGEGILLNDDQKQVLIANLKGRVKQVSSHDTCGAAAIAHPGEKSDSEGASWAKELATAIGADYVNVSAKDFVSPVHHERALVADATGKFDCANLAGFPPQFISSASSFGLDDQYIKTEIKTLTGIALGDHGLGERFNTENPFYVIVSAEDDQQLEHLISVSEEAVSDFNDRVKVTGFVGPISQE